MEHKVNRYLWIHIPTNITLMIRVVVVLSTSSNFDADQRDQMLE